MAHIPTSHSQHDLTRTISRVNASISKPDVDTQHQTVLVMVPVFEREARVRISTFTIVAIRRIFLSVQHTMSDTVIFEYMTKFALEHHVLNQLSDTCRTVLVFLTQPSPPTCCSSLVCIDSYANVPCPRPKSTSLYYDQYRFLKLNCPTQFQTERTTQVAVCEKHDQSFAIFYTLSHRSFRDLTL